MDKIIQQMTDWLKEETLNANAKGLLVGISGGLDSAVVAHLIKQAFPDDSLGVIMPVKNNPVDIHDAETVVESANINTMTINLTEAHHSLYETISNGLKHKEYWDESSDRISDANLRARLRMSTLYTVASQMGYLVVGTENAPEWYTGYFTKYGDGGVDLQPIIQWTKQEVRDAAQYFQVPETVIHKKPSADLWFGQTDEEEMGTSYDHIDAYLEGKTVPEKDQEVIETLHQRTAHKRQIATQFRFR